MKKLKHLFDRNKTWASSLTNKDPNFFTNLAKEQTPKYLWIGCSDSRVAANQIIDSPPGELFVHRNIANVVAHTDLNCLSVIQFAVEVLHVKHIIVCGHYGCGGIKASLENKPHGMIDNWLQHIRDVIRLNTKEFESLSDNQKADRLCELNVIEQVRNVCNTTVVNRAWSRGVDLTVHGWIYNLENGFLKDLDACFSLDDYQAN